VCDLDTAAQATPVTYTGTGLTYNNTPLAPVGPAGALVVNGTAAGPSALLPAPTNLTSAGVYSIVVGGPCRVEGPTSYMTCTGQPQNDEAEQFAVFPAIGSSLAAGQALQPGSNILIKSIKTGKFCRVVAVGDKQQILCDVDDAAAASTMIYTGSGFSHQGQGFANYGSSQPLQLGGPGSTGTPGTLNPSRSRCAGHA
jgi:hypothetical protein